MKKINSLFVGFAAIALLASCSNDELLNDEPTPAVPETPLPEGGTAYMKINISDVNSPNGMGTYSTEYPSEDSGFKYGDYSEHRVASAKFLFFDEAGTFVLEGNVADPNFGSDGLPATPDHNVEYIGKDNILVLEKLTEKGWPKYMITVLNAPDFTPEATMQATAEKLDTYYRNLLVKPENGGDKTTESCMVMSTSSYFGESTNHEDAYPYATTLVADNFKLTPAEAQADANAVKIYVERLAAKVELNLGLSESITVNGRKLYKLAQTVAGDPNEDGGSSTADTELYLDVLGWSLSATATKSHMSKQLLSDWATTDPYTGWNEASRFRSYWAKSALYSTNAYDEANLMPDMTGVANPGLGLVYTTFNNNIKTVGSFDYCNELTSSANNIFTKDSEGRDRVDASQATHVVLKTRVCDKDGNPIDMISYHGVLYTTEHYKNYMLNKIQNGDPANLNFYTLISEDTYSQVDANAFEVKSDNSGKTGHITLKVKAGITLYAKQPDGTFASANAADLQAKMDAVQPGVTSNNPAVNFNNGANVYYIPIEHYAPSATITASEGYYGVVRNHWYRLTISSFSHVGHGVFDPENETLKPEGPEDILYYLGVNINILSWKIVNQNVPL